MRLRQFMNLQKPRKRQSVKCICYTQSRMTLIGSSMFTHFHEEGLIRYEDFCPICQIKPESEETDNGE